MVHVVFAEVVLRQVCDVRLLDMGNVGRSQHSDVHGGGKKEMRLLGEALTLRKVR